MALEIASKISELVATNPTGADRVKDGDNHIRLMKQILLNSVGNSGDLIIVFDTRGAAIASTNLTVGKYVRTAGKLTVGDGQGGLYRVVAAGTGTPDDLNYIDLTGSTGQLELIDIDESTAITYERQVMAGGETVITSATAYKVGTNALQVFLNGIRQVTPTDYSEDSTTQFTMQEALKAGDKLDIYVFGVTLSQVAAGSIVFTPAGNIAANNIQAAIEELDAEKSDISHTHPYLDESLNLSDVASPATAFDNIKQNATSSYKGVGRSATQGEVDAGTAGADLFVTPSTLKNSALLVTTATRSQNVTATVGTGNTTSTATVTIGTVAITTLNGNTAKSRLVGRLVDVQIALTSSGTNAVVTTDGQVEVWDGTKLVGTGGIASAADTTFTVDVDFDAWPIRTYSGGVTTLTLKVKATITKVPIDEGTSSSGVGSATAILSNTKLVSQFFV